MEDEVINLKFIFRLKEFLGIIIMLILIQLFHLISLITQVSIGLIAGFAICYYVLDKLYYDFKIEEHEQISKN